MASFFSGFSLLYNSRIYGMEGAWDNGQGRRSDFVNSGLLYSAVYGVTGGAEPELAALAAADSDEEVVTGHRTRYIRRRRRLHRMARRKRAGDRPRTDIDHDNIDTAFRQQRLKAWQPILTPKTVLPLFFAVGIIFAPLGGLLLWASSQVQEMSIEYQHCTRDATSDFSAIPSKYVSSHFKNATTPSQAPQWSTRNETVRYHNNAVSVNTPICTLRFYIPDDLAPPVLLYYQLTNFYQNHPIVTLCVLVKTPVNYTMTNQGIAWASDRDLYKQTPYTVDQVVPPPNWRMMYPEYSNEIPIPNIHEWEEFHVWMRTAGLPAFSKLARRNDNATMRSGQYEMDIYDYFPVNEYHGTKSVLFSTRTIMGGKNPFLGIAYIVVAGVCIVLGALFTATHLIKPRYVISQWCFATVFSDSQTRKLGDHTYLSWNNDQPSTATTTGRA
ncbi:Lem3/Cdc50, partial [Aureobasidium melanogenum]